MSDGQGARPRFEPEQEVRFAVVMYGGVSLAIYINGVAQELFRLVRATAPAEPYAEAVLDEHEKINRVYFPGEPDDTRRRVLTGSERVYRKLGQMLGAVDVPTAEPTTADPIRTRFVVDIISGTSAGGINGVFLGSAIANQQNFGVSADLWRDVADIEDLLREPRSFSDLPAGTPQDAQSLLNGYRLYWKARDAMQKMSDPEQEPGEGGGEERPADKFRPAYAEQLDLAVTATDLGGLPLPVRLSYDRHVDERSHRTVLRFSYGTEETTGEGHTDFSDLDLLLAFAARATSSFPFAFEPVELGDLRALEPAGYDAKRAEFARFFPAHTRARLAAEEIPFADGGYLDNKPFSYATEALRSRRADVPVSRKLVYIEPHPTAETAAAVLPRPDVLGNLRDALSLPRQETIREDVAAVGARNLAVGRLQDLGLSVERRLHERDTLEAVRTAAAATSDRDIEQQLGLVAQPWAAYRALRTRTALDDLAELATHFKDVDIDNADGRAVRAALRGWIEAEHAATQRAFLRAYDVAFQRRRLSFMNDRINDLLRRGPRASRLLAVAAELGIADAPRLDAPRAVLDAPEPPDLPEAAAKVLADEEDALRRLKVELNEQHDLLRRAARAPYAQRLGSVLDAEQLERFDAVVSAGGKLPDDPSRFMDAVGTFLAAPLAQADTALAGALAATTDPPANWIGALLKAYDDRFEAFDMIVLPLAYPDLGETNTVDILRISPLDAQGIKPVRIGADPTRKLGGVRVHHFGGFLERAWRDNDLMWGRLDAAEAIIETLLSDASEELRTQLREEAQAAILREELNEGTLARTLDAELQAAAGEVADHALVEAFRGAYEPLAEIPADRRDDLAARTAKITGDVLAEAARAREWPSWPFTALGEAAQLTGRARSGVTWVREKSHDLAARVRPRVRRGWPPIRFGDG